MNEQNLAKLAAISDKYSSAIFTIFIKEANLNEIEPEKQKELKAILEEL